MEKLLPVNKHNKTRRRQMPHNILHKNISVHNPFYKFMSRRMAWGTLSLHSPQIPCVHVPECHPGSSLPVPEPS